MAQRDIIKHLEGCGWVSTGELAKKCAKQCTRPRLTQSLRTMLKHGEVERRIIIIKGNIKTYEYRLTKSKGFKVEGLKLGSTWHK